MKLKNVAKMFNNTRCSDAYSGDFVFNGQLDVYTEGVRDGVTIKRRVLELAPGTTLPPRRCIEFEGLKWIIGTLNIDIWKGEKIREKYAIQEAEGLAQVHSLAGLLAGTAPHEAYASRIWVRTAKEVEEDSDEFNQMTIYFAPGELVGLQQLVLISGRYHIVKETYPATAGFLAAVSEVIDDPVLDNVTVITGDRDPVTEVALPGATYRCLMLRWRSDFRYLSQATPNFERGDAQMVVDTLAAVAPGYRVQTSESFWRVINVLDDHGVRYCHVRREAP